MNASIPLLRVIQSKRLQSPKHRRPSRFAQRAAVLMFAIPFAVVCSAVIA